MSHHYSTKEDFIATTLKVLSEKVLTEPLTLEVRNVVGTLSGEKQDELEGEVAIELSAIDATCRNGLSYDH